MSKPHSSNMDDDSIGAEKDSEEATTSSSPESSSSSSSSSSPQHRQLGKISFKSLTALSAKDSLENLQKIRRRSAEGSRRAFCNRAGSAGEKRARKKSGRRRIDKPNVSEVNIRKLDVEDAGKLVSVVNLKKAAGKPKQPSDDASKGNLDENANIVASTSSTEAEPQPPNASASEESAPEVLQSLEKLRIDEPEEANGKSTVDYSSGDAAQEEEEEDFELGLSLDDSCFAGMACARIFEAKRRSVQWKREVDVIYYAGDADGGKGRVVRRENEPLREEAEQQARRNRFIQLALTKNLLRNVGACQLRDPWLVMLPK